MPFCIKWYLYMNRQQQCWDLCYLLCLFIVFEFAMLLISFQDIFGKLLRLALFGIQKYFEENIYLKMTLSTNMIFSFEITKKNILVEDFCQYNVIMILLFCSMFSLIIGSPCTFDKHFALLIAFCIFWCQ